MKTAIVYISTHHGNTKKLAEAVQGAMPDVDLYDLKETTPDLSGYDCIGLASGIYGFQLSPELVNFVKTHMLPEKTVFCMYTYGGINKKSYTKALKELVAQAGSRYVGEYCCTGFNTFGPFKLMGGSAKGHPNVRDLNGAAAFVKTVLAQME